MSETLSWLSTISAFRDQLFEKHPRAPLVAALLFAGGAMIAADLRADNLGPLAEFGIDVLVFAALIPFVVRYNVNLALKARRESEAAAEAALAEERRALARELHDSIAQHLCYLHLKLDELTVSERGGAVQVARDLEQMRRVANQAYEDIYCLMTALRSGPAADLTSTLRARLELTNQQTDFETSLVEVGQSRELQSCYEQEIALIVREALTNVEKHAQASHVDVTIRWSAEQLAVSVHDNGRGFDGSAKPGHLGLSIMQERCAEMGGSLAVRSQPGHGTVVEFTIPLERIVGPAPEPCNG